MQVQTFNIALPKELVKRVDEVAKKEYRNRSELIREALRIYLTDLEQWNQVFNYGRKKGQEVAVKNAGDVDKIVTEYRHGQ